MLTPLPHYFSTEHEAFRTVLRQFVQREIAPFVHAWDEAGGFPRELYRQVAELGWTGVGYASEYGGTPADVFFQVVAAEEIARAGSGGLQASLGSHTIALPPIAAAGSIWLKQKVLTPVLAGQKIAALAITEPGGGSDVAALRTAAIRDGDYFRVSGSKTFITSGMRADFLTVAVRTDPHSQGASGLSLLLIEGDTPGLSRTPLAKMGWWASDTATLFFDDCRVPVEHLIGTEGQGFKLIMQNFNHERIWLAAGSCVYAQLCLDEALNWARERHTFGAPLIERQVIRHKLVEMRLRIDAARALLYESCWRLQQEPAGRVSGELVAQICMVKVLCAQVMQHCADQAVQILGGLGYMRGCVSERIYREVKVMMIGGGGEEIMKDLAARQLGW